jgi:hypothetical protein
MNQVERKTKINPEFISNSLNNLEVEEYDHYNEIEQSKPFNKYETELQEQENMEEYGPNSNNFVGYEYYGTLDNDVTGLNQSNSLLNPSCDVTNRLTCDVIEMMRSFENIESRSDIERSNEIENSNIESSSESETSQDEFEFYDPMVFDVVSCVGLNLFW